MYIYCNRPSKSARALAKALKWKKVTHVAGEQLFKKNKLYINWGVVNMDPFLHPDERNHPEGREGLRVINHPEAVRKAADKLLFFQAMKDTKLTPRFYTASAEASKAIESEKVIVCRTVLNGHSGHGVVIAHRLEELVPARLYVEYIKKETEWRVHVFQGKVIDVQRKARNRAIPDDQVNWSIRSHANGFVYTRGDIEDYKLFDGWDLLNKLHGYSIKTIKQIGLDFGAVDLIVTSRGKVYVLEVNTAPGLEGTTLENYVKAIKEIV